MRKLVIVPAFAALAVPPAAAAKEITAAKICGASVCVTTTNKAALMRIAESSAPLMSSEVPRPSPYYTISFRMSEPGHGVVGRWNAWWVPSTGALGAPGESGSPVWSSISGRAREFLTQRTAALAPFPTPRLRRVLVGTRPVRDPNSYLRLLTPAWPVSAESASDWKRIVVTASAPNPWSAHAHLLYSPSTNVLWRGAERFDVPKRIAANIEAGRSLDAAAPGRSYEWAWAAGVVALLSAVGVTIARRRRG